MHPGYGFLSENARFAEILEEHEITFIGPTSEHIRIMGDKIEAKATARRLGIPVVPGSDGAITDEAQAMQHRQATSAIPVLVKAAAGGGGRGMKVARTPRRPRHGARRPRAPRPRPRSATTASISRNISSKPRHIEVQVFGDGKGNAIHLGERDCSLQRRHQKVWEEAPSPALNADAAREDRRRPWPTAMRKLRYRGAGTVEFLYEDGEFYFIEMNTRLQVEHPVTEMITGLDLVIEQIRIAAGAPLTLTQEDVALRRPRHRVPHQCREPAGPSAPSPGTITYFHPPGGLGVRVDSGAYAGYTHPALLRQPDRQAHRARQAPATSA